MVVILLVRLKFVCCDSYVVVFSMMNNSVLFMMVIVMMVFYGYFDYIFVCVELVNELNMISRMIVWLILLMIGLCLLMKLLSIGCSNWFSMNGSSSCLVMLSSVLLIDRFVFEVWIMKFISSGVVIMLIRFEMVVLKMVVGMLFLVMVVIVIDDDIVDGSVYR